MLNESLKERKNLCFFNYHFYFQFLGNTEVDQPKGIEVVKEAIRKMKFNQHLKRAEGSKIPKVELTISIDGVAIQDPKTKINFHQYPLHRISYCADDKSDKKFFSFIAKESDSERHSCFVFVSDKLAEEITLTIGQAFDLAYKKFLETSGRDLEMRRQLMILQKRVKELEQENFQLKTKLNSLEEKTTATTITAGRVKATQQSHEPPTHDLVNGSSTCNSTNSNPKQPSQQTITTKLQPPPSALPRTLNRSFSANQSVNLLDIDISQPSVGRRLENLSLEEPDDDDFNPRANETVTHSNSNGTNGHINNRNGMTAKDLFGCEPFDQSLNAKDPFGMGNFGAQELENAIGAIDKKLAEMRVSF